MCSTLWGDDMIWFLSRKLGIETDEPKEKQNSIQEMYEDVNSTVKIIQV